jgi:hypothetical protein
VVAVAAMSVWEGGSATAMVEEAATVAAEEADDGRGGQRCAVYIFLVRLFFSPSPPLPLNAKATVRLLSFLLQTLLVDCCLHCFNHCHNCRCRRCRHRCHCCCHRHRCPCHHHCHHCRHRSRAIGCWAHQAKKDVEEQINVILFVTKKLLINHQFNLV